MSRTSTAEAWPNRVRTPHPEAAAGLRPLPTEASAHRGRTSPSGSACDLAARPESASSSPAVPSAGRGQQEGPTAYDRPPARLEDHPGRSLARVWVDPAVGMPVLLREGNWRRFEMAATSVREPEISLHTVERPLDLVGASELELARLLTWETTDEHNAVDQIAWQMLQGAQNLRRWIWTMVLVALALVVGFFLPSP